ncbi:deoxyguanosinetriphosphate triphosphohydrolase [Devosia rhodophyticola]|uniref:Deoxyguanosinetriphosphate triphosphohydrolase-like protein n=1 Tax=Devosia rhodophyticola TaxID=3026423 RepID=A0ABY7YX20_9HYPH|nr:deoxyguanosinetriphosphate triphosphohydrolase [Devosia rhodophyticola]WDR05752.1 deoxyguanosinetriphosphate triphosphohydrolase [Devosia rhodophyticola]
MSDHASYAANPEQSRGRLFSTGSSPTRSAFQRDRDRIIHSTAFRRLQNKTQVFLHHEGRHFRNRLTHTLEVSQMARSMARALSLDEDLAEAVALSHDLGHTPFGHAGERVLDEKLARFGGFDHNVQAIRVVTRLENRYAEHDGLNLTWETLEGILKHNGPLTDKSGKPVGKYRKDGLPVGLDDIPVSEDLQLWNYASLEAQTAAIADDVAYNSHDIDDALRANLILLRDLEDVPLVGPIVNEVLSLYPDIAGDRQAHEVQRRLITRSIEDVIATTRSAIAGAGIENIEDVRNSGQMLVRFSDEMAAAEKGLKGFLFERVYRHKSVMQLVGEAEGMVARLFDQYLSSLEMPGRWGIAAKAAPNDAAQARVVADFVAGMTDPYAIDEYVRLFDARQ